MRLACSWTTATAFVYRTSARGSFASTATSRSTSAMLMPSSVRSAASSAVTWRPSEALTSTPSSRRSASIRPLITPLYPVSSLSGAAAPRGRALRRSDSPWMASMALTTPASVTWDRTSAARLVTALTWFCSRLGSTIRARKPIDSRRSCCRSWTSAPTWPATRTVRAVSAARVAWSTRPSTIGTARATTASSGIVTRRASLPRIRNLPSSTGLMTASQITSTPVRVIANHPPEEPSPASAGLPFGKQPFLGVNFPRYRAGSLPESAISLIVRYRSHPVALSEVCRNSQIVERLATSGCRVKGRPHRLDRRRYPGEQRELADPLGEQQVEPGRDRAAGPLSGRSQRGRPRVVDRVEEHRAGAPGDVHAVRDALRHRRDHQVGPAGLGGPVERAVHQRQAQLRSDRAERVDRGGPAGVDDDPGGAEVLGGGEGGPGGTAGAQDGDGVHGREPGTPQHVDHARRVGVLGVPAICPPYQRVGRTERGGDRGDLVGHDERHLFERHGQRQPAPLRAEPGAPIGQLGLGALVRGVPPVRQPGRRVPGVVDDRRERVRDRLAQDRGLSDGHGQSTPFFLASLMLAWCSASVVANLVCPSLSTATKYT